jgi:putative thioredoxin
MMASDYIHDVSESNFDSLVIEFSFQAPVVVDFWAEWCNPCKMLGPLLERLAIEAGGAFHLAKVDIDSNQNLAIRFGVHSIPAVKGFKDGKVVAEFIGVQQEARVRDFLRNIAHGKYELLLEKAHNTMVLNKWKESEATLLQVLEGDPGNSSALLGLSRCYIMLGRTSEAHNILTNFPASREYTSAEKLHSLVKAIIKQKNSEFDSDTPLEAAFNNALKLIQRGYFPAAMDGLLDILREAKNYRSGEARLILLGIFELLGEQNEDTRQYRQELASILF